MTTLCLYLPNVCKKYKHNDIKYIFKKYKFGTIHYINIVTTKFNYNRVFIDFTIWFDTDRNNKLKNILEDNKSFKIFYNEYEFWNCYKAKSRLNKSL